MIVELLEDYGYEAQRFVITWLSSVEPDAFVKAVCEMTARVKKLGPVYDDAQAG